MRLSHSNKTKAAIASLIAVILINVSCSREPRNTRPAVGQTVTIEPISPEMFHLTKGREDDSIKLEVSWGGHPLKKQSDLTLRFLDEKRSVVFEMPWQKLEKAYQSTGCKNDHIAKLDGYLLGVALICDGSLDLSQVKVIEGIDKDGKKRQTKNWMSYPIGKGIKAVSVGLY